MKQPTTVSDVRPRLRGNLFFRTHCNAAPRADAVSCCETNDLFHFKGKTRGAFTLPKGARNVFLNESEDTRNVLGEFQRVCKRWTSVTDRDFAAVENI